MKRGAVRLGTTLGPRPATPTSDVVKIEAALPAESQKAAKPAAKKKAARVKKTATKKPAAKKGKGKK